MPSENPAAEIASPVVPLNVAPPREKRLVPVPPQSGNSRKRPLTAVAVAQTRPVGRPVPVSAVESKVAAMHDPAEMLKVIHTEAVLRRAQRLSGQGDAQRQTIRLLSICMLFALLAAAIGAMWYLQTSLQGSRRAHRPAAQEHGAPAGR